MSTEKTSQESQRVKETVRTGYAAIATGQRSCCCSSPRSSQADPTRLAQAIGYDAESLAICRKVRTWAFPAATL